MAARVKNLKECLKALNGNKEGKPDQVKDTLGTYIGLWQKAIEKGVVNPADDMENALEKIEELGGLYRAAEE